MTRQVRGRRRGAAAVEMAFVLPVVILLIFGIIEYGRLLGVKQLMDEAARTGARYAVVNTSLASATLISNTKSQVTTAMSGMDSQLVGGAVTPTVFQSDASGNQINADPTQAKFGQFICVKVTGTYAPLLPSYLYLGSGNIPLTSQAVMCSEAN